MTNNPQTHSMVRHRELKTIRDLIATPLCKYFVNNYASINLNKIGDGYVDFVPKDIDTRHFKLAYKTSQVTYLFRQMERLQAFVVLCKLHTIKLLLQSSN